MDISSIYVHDGKLLRVVEDAEQNKVKMAVLLPVDPMSEKLAPRLLVFDDVYGYQIFEGRVAGCPTILDLSVVEQSGRWSRVRIDTNHGYRELYCTAVRLCEPYNEVA
jgi:hypothetical protein